MFSNRICACRDFHTDTDNNKEEDINNEEEEDINNKEEDVGNEEEDVDDEKEENKDTIDNMPPPKLKQVAVTPPKKTVKKELGVEKLTTAISKTLKISTPVCKPFLMKTLDGYMVKPYCQKYTNFVGVNVHVAGVLMEHAYKVDLRAEHDLEA